MKRSIILLVGSLLLLAVVFPFAAELEVHDSRFTASIVAEAPKIVTPIGAAVDPRDRLFVIESHTHHPPNNYSGPKSDRIKIFDPANPGEPKIFAEGFNAGMNLAFAPGGALYVICAGEIWRLEDRDNDDVADRRQRIVELVTTDRYAHSRLLGITFGPDELLYLSRGNTGGHKYTLRGADGSTVSGYGEGGNIMRCQPDGTKVEMFATGFWNPFDLKFDSSGRLLAVDNDPDARGPNRLVHVVKDGDYGYLSLYGGSGNHPFQGWNGELPGTLPFISGTGEAPSGLLDCGTLPFPPGFERSALITIWGENTIERHDLSPAGISVRGQASVFLSGGKDFRPVAITADSKGNLYVTDWVKVDYPNHGEGRIWKISPQETGRKRSKKETQFDLPAFSNLRQIRRALQSEDPFLRHAAVMQLPPHQSLELARNDDPAVRLGAMLALKRAKNKNLLPHFLGDPHELVRQGALIWAGESGEVSMRPQLDIAINQSTVSAALFRTYLAAVECLDPQFVADFRAQRTESAKALKRSLEAGLVERIIADESRPASLRAVAITQMNSVDTPSGLRLLVEVARSAPENVRVAAMEKLAHAREAEAREDLVDIALDGENSNRVRAAAVGSLAWYHLPEPERLVPLLQSSSSSLRLQSIFTLRAYLESELVKEAFAKFLENRKKEPSRILKELEFILGVTNRRPDSVESWVSALRSGGDATLGRQVFFSPIAACATCHTIGGRGGKVGPDLSNIAQSLNREQLVRGTLRPNEQFAPQWQAWVVETTNEETYSGVQADVHGDGSITIFLSSGQWHTIPGAEVQQVYASKNSIMPEGLEAGLSVESLRDLMAFLSSLK